MKFEEFEKIGAGLKAETKKFEQVDYVLGTSNIAGVCRALSAAFLVKNSVAALVAQGDVVDENEYQQKSFFEYIKLPIIKTNILMWQTMFSTAGKVEEAEFVQSIADAVEVISKRKLKKVKSIPFYGPSASTQDWFVNIKNPSFWYLSLQGQSDGHAIALSHRAGKKVKNGKFRIFDPNCGVASFSGDDGDFNKKACGEFLNIILAKDACCYAVSFEYSGDAPINDSLIDKVKDKGGIVWSVPKKQ